MDLVGKNLGQFEIVEELGRGGMAAVYKAYQPSLHRHVAIKVLLPSLAEDMDLVKRFLREAQSAAALRHPNVVTIHDVGSQDNTHYIVMEFIEGITLAELLAQEQFLSAERILHIAKQVADALDYAHSKGFIHRDIKPSNLMISPERDDRVILTDFGLVRATSGSRLTRTGFIMGTADYMSPEQAKGDALDHRTDIYSFGVMLYHMFTGNVPFPKPTPHAILMAHIMDEPPAMSAPNRHIGREVEAVVHKAMAKMPDDRYAWAGDLVADLEIAVLKPDTFIIPAMEQMTPYQSPTVVGKAPVTPPQGVLRPQTPPQGTAYRPTSPGGVVYPQTTPPGYVVSPATPPVGVAAPPARFKWVLWLVLALLAIGIVVVVGGIIAYPLVMNSLSAARTATAVARIPPTPTATLAPEVKVEKFSVTPSEITQGESVTIEWRVSGVRSVSIEPNVKKDTEPSGVVVDKPSETTRYELVLPDGHRESFEVKVNPAAGAPVIESFTATPPEQVRGGEVKLAWKIVGATTSIEVSVNYRPEYFDLPAEGTLVVSLPKSGTLLLTAYNGDQKSSKTLELEVVDPTPTPMPTATSTPTEVPTDTPTPIPPTSTPTPTSPPVTPAKATPTSTTPPTAGALVGFENFGVWRRGDQPYGEFTQSSEQVKSGKYAGKLVYDFTKATSADDFVIFEQKTAVSGQPNQVSVWVYGDGSGHFFNVWIMDSAGEMWSIAMGKIGGASWQKMSGAIDPKRPWPTGYVYGPKNGVIDYPVRFAGIVIDRVDGPKTGTLYFDDVSFQTTQAATGTPEPGATATTEAGGTGEIGRIVFTVQTGDNYYLYSTDPNWSNMVEIGRTTQANSTCAENSTVARTLDGKTINIRKVDVCPVAGTVGSCPAPNGVYKANTANVGGTNYAVTLARISDNAQVRSYYVGPLDIFGGINWAPDSSHFLFTDVNMGVCRADTNKDGFHVVISVKYRQWPAQFTPDGSYVYFLRLVSGENADVFVIRSDGSGERNLTNSPAAKKLCPRWLNQ